MLTPKRQLGNLGENWAVNFLRERNYKILDRNFLAKLGELDIVAAKTGGFLNQKILEVVFVEVKTVRPETSLALAAQNVHFFKKKRLIKTAQLYLKAKKIPSEIPWRIDVILVALDQQKGLAKIEHLENAVW